VIAVPAIAPPKVATFHAKNRLSSAPSRNPNVRSPLAETTPNASSVRKNAATGRRQPTSVIRRPRESP
jgi:hypothetical protein